MLKLRKMWHFKKKILAHFEIDCSNTSLHDKKVGREPRLCCVASPKSVNMWELRRTVAGLVGEECFPILIWYKILCLLCHIFGFTCFQTVSSYWPVAKLSEKCPTSYLCTRNCCNLNFVCPSPTFLRHAAVTKFKMR